MGEGKARIEELRDEYCDIAFELRRPRAEDAAERDRKRMQAIEDALAQLGTGVGPRPADLPPEVE